MFTSQGYRLGYADWDALAVDPISVTMGADGVQEYVFGNKERHGLGGDGVDRGPFGTDFQNRKSNQEFLKWVYSERQRRMKF